MRLHILSPSEILIPPNRQRREIDPEYIVALADSIRTNGLIHPPTIRIEGDQAFLVAGECRLKAINYVWQMGDIIRCGLDRFEEGRIPCISVGDLPAIEAYELELEENIRRSDLSWQDRASATSQLYELRNLQAENKGEPAVTPAAIAKEIHGAEKVENRGHHQEKVRREIILFKHLSNPEVKKAKTLDEAFKIVKRKEELQKSADLGRLIGKTFTSADHTCLNKDALEAIQSCEDSTFDVVLTDPPYGMDAQDFSDSGGKAHGGHFYDDSYEYFDMLMSTFLPETFRVTKPDAHLYLFCDIDRFLDLRNRVESAGWRPFRSPLIWVYPGGNRIPWPKHGPQRKYQFILYAIKGDRPLKKHAGDVLTFPNDQNLNHNAQKPVALYQELLSRSCSPGDAAADFFMGTGPLFPAAHALKVKAFGCDRDEASYGIALERLRKLK